MNIKPLFVKRSNVSGTFRYIHTTILYTYICIYRRVSIDSVVISLCRIIMHRIQCRVGEYNRVVMNRDAAIFLHQEPKTYKCMYVCIYVYMQYVYMYMYLHRRRLSCMPMLIASDRHPTTTTTTRHILLHELLRQDKLMYLHCAILYMSIYIYVWIVKRIMHICARISLSYIERIFTGKQ